MVRFDRKGQIVPNLYVHINETGSQTNLNNLNAELPANELLAEQPN